MTHGGEVPNMDLLHILVIVLAPQLCTGRCVFIFFCLQQQLTSALTDRLRIYGYSKSTIHHNHLNLLKVKFVSAPPGEKCCSIQSTAGSEVEIGSSFKIYCTVKCKRKGSMYSDNPPTSKAHEVFNATTIYMNVANLTKDQTYSCQCDCPGAQDSCGMDIFTGCECKNHSLGDFRDAQSQHLLSLGLFLVPNPKCC